MTESERRSFIQKVEALDDSIDDLGVLLSLDSRSNELHSDDLATYRELSHIRSEIEHRLMGQQVLFEVTKEVA